MEERSGFLETWSAKTGVTCAVGWRCIWLCGGRHLEGTQSVHSVASVNATERCWWKQLRQTAHYRPEESHSLSCFLCTCYPGEGLIAASHCPSRWAGGEGWGCLRSPQPPSHPAPLRFSAPSSTMPLASDRNLELSGLGINCLDAFVQDSFSHQLSEVLFEIHGSPL